MAYSQTRGGGASRLKVMLLIGLVMASFSLCKYFSSADYNEVTGETQYISLTESEEITMGIQTAPEMAQRHGGLHPDQAAQDLVDEVGAKLLQNDIIAQSPYQYAFHLLADDQTVNAFALPGGQVFITAALFSRLENEAQLAGVLGHEIGHVEARHSAERIAKQELTSGLIGAATVAAGDYNAQQIGQMVGKFVNMKFGRDQELQSDELGVRFMLEAGYDPRELIGVMRILKEASGGASQPEFSSSHPDPENRMEKIVEAIQKYDKSGKYLTQ